MGQSARLTTETQAMRAFELAIERARALSPRAQQRVLDWAEERVGEALAVAKNGYQDLDQPAGGAWAGLAVGLTTTGGGGRGTTGGPGGSGDAIGSAGGTGTAAR
jgi:hypothetical protein